MWEHGLEDMVAYLRAGATPRLRTRRRTRR